MKLCTSEQMRALEQAAVAAGTPLDELMEQAGLAVAQEVWLNLGVVAGRRVLVLVGPGNNGGDGLVAARHLADWEAGVCVYMLAARDGDKNLDLLRERNVTVFTATEDAGYSRLAEALDGAEVVVDALLGIGAAGPLAGEVHSILGRLRPRLEQPRPPTVIAVDLPTGVNADTGATDQLAVKADLTVTFGCAKLGLYTFPGSGHAGRVEVVDIGIPPQALRGLPFQLLTPAWVREELPKRPRSANKGTFGKVLLMAGSRQYPGAARLSAEACYRSGAGLVTVASTDDVQRAVSGSLPEATWRILSDENGQIGRGSSAEIVAAMQLHDIMLVGPGLGQSDALRESIPEILSASPTEGRCAGVVDADGLNALAPMTDETVQRLPELILTPHPGEMARLLGVPVEQVQADRLNVAIEAAAKWGQTIVLKGAHTIVVDPDGRAAVSPYANPLLAVAGTGDVLAGVIAGLLAQGMAPLEAAACGVYVHAFAAEELAEELGDRGLLASELLPAIPRAMRTILHGKPSRASSPMAGGIGDISAMLAGLGGGAPEPP